MLTSLLTLSALISNLRMPLLNLSSSLEQKLLSLARDHLVKAREAMVKYNTHKTLPPPFKVHDLVLVHKSAFKKNHPLPRPQQIR